MSILDTIRNFIYQIICFFYSLLPIKWDKCNICPDDTCAYNHSREYTMEYSSELNLNSSCDDIKNYIITNLEEINPSAFHSSDDTPITDTMKKELIFVLENRSDMIRKDNDITSPGIKFIFCCPDEHQCIINGD